MREREIGREGGICEESELQRLAERERDWKGRRKVGICEESELQRLAVITQQACLQRVCQSHAPVCTIMIRRVKEGGEGDRD